MGTETELIGDISEMELIPIEGNTNKPKYYNKVNTKVCPVCGKVFNATVNWAYRKDSKWYCCYTHYVQAGGDGGLDRLNGKKRRYYNNTKGAR